jgi:hypothetical protein
MLFLRSKPRQHLEDSFTKSNTPENHEAGLNYLLGIFHQKENSPEKGLRGKGRRADGSHEDLISFNDLVKQSESLGSEEREIRHVLDEKLTHTHATADQHFPAEEALEPKANTNLQENGTPLFQVLHNVNADMEKRIQEEALKKQRAHLPSEFGDEYTGRL